MLTRVFLAMAHAALGRAAEAEEAVRRIRAMAPHFGDHAIADFRARNFHPDLIAEIARALQRAGLPVKAEAGQ